MIITISGMCVCAGFPVSTITETPSALPALFYALMKNFFVTQMMPKHQQPHNSTALFVGGALVKLQQQHSEHQYLLLCTGGFQSPPKPCFYFQYSTNTLLFCGCPFLLFFIFSLQQKDGSYPPVRLVALTFFLLVAGTSFFAPEVVEADIFDDIGDAISAFVEVRIRKSLIFLPVMHFSFFLTPICGRVHFFCFFHFFHRTSRPPLVSTSW